MPSWPARGSSASTAPIATAGCGTCLIAATPEEALAAGRRLPRRRARRNTACGSSAISASCWAAISSPTRSSIARLQSADDLPGLPLDCVLATEAFAAQAKFDLGEKILLVPVGRAEIMPAAEDSERQAIRSRPSLPIYTVEWAKARLRGLVAKFKAGPGAAGRGRRKSAKPRLRALNESSSQCPSPSSISTVRSTARRFDDRHSHDPHRPRAGSADRLSGRMHRGRRRACEARARPGKRRLHHRAGRLVRRRDRRRDGRDRHRDHPGKRHHRGFGRPALRLLSVGVIIQHVDGPLAGEQQYFPSGVEITFGRPPEVPTSPIPRTTPRWGGSISA